MREILFRGKCTDTGTWYTGGYIHLRKTTYCFLSDYDMHPDNDIHRIVFERMTDWGLPNQHLMADVVPETVGQYTGLNDMNGTRIFEGDVLRITERGITIDGGIVIFENGYPGGWLITDKEHKSKCSLATRNCVEIIGNIHDNPEFLRGN